MFGEIICPYKDKCRDYPHLCHTCRHNKRRSYYEPDKWRPDYFWFRPSNRIWELHRYRGK